MEFLGKCSLNAECFIMFACEKLSRKSPEERKKRENCCFVLARHALSLSIARQQRSNSDGRTQSNIYLCPGRTPIVNIHRCARVEILGVMEKKLPNRKELLRCATIKHELKPAINNADTRRQIKCDSLKIKSQ